MFSLNIAQEISHYLLRFLKLLEILFTVFVVVLGEQIGPITQPAIVTVEVYEQSISCACFTCTQTF
jgi:hypothetical protein